MIENVIEEMSEQWKNIMKKTYGGADIDKGMTYRGKHANLIISGGRTRGDSDIKGEQK